MALASQLPGSRNVDAWLARIYGSFRVLALPSIFLTLLAPATVWGDIYKWTDERGNTVFSNIKPVNPNKVSHLELLGTETRPVAQSPIAPSQQTATRTEQALKARIENLERQLQAQKYVQPPQAVPPSIYPGDYYPAPAPLPPEPNNYSSDNPGYNPGYDAEYDPGYYQSYDPGYDPGYYPSYYASWPASYSSVAAPARTVVRRPAVVSRVPVFVGRTPTFVGPTPQFVGPTPVFVGPTPVFVGPTPQFVGPIPTFAGPIASRPANGFSHGASFGGGSMHRGR